MTRAIISAIAAGLLLTVVSLRAQPAPANGGEPQLYFSKMAHTPLDATPLVFRPRAKIALTLNLKTTSLAERDRLSLLTIDDYRFDNRKRGRNPNVRFDVMEMRRGTEYLAASFKVATDGDQRLDGLYHEASVWFLLGRSEAVYWMTDHFGGLSSILDSHWEGTYRIRASYDRWVSPPVFVTVR
jgi:hypothetical protein